MDRAGSAYRDSRVVLTREKDKIGLKRVRLDWRLTRLDRPAIRRAHQIIREAVEQSGIGTADSTLSPETDSEWPSDINWGWHHMGTTRMHDDPGQGVVDRRSQRCYANCELVCRGQLRFSDRRQSICPR